MKDWETAWAIVLAAGKYEVIYILPPSTSSVSYKELQREGWLIRRPGQDWQRCEKDEVVQ